MGTKLRSKGLFLIQCVWNYEDKKTNSSVLPPGQNKKYMSFKVKYLASSGQTSKIRKNQFRER